MIKEKIKAGQLIYGTGYTALTHAWASSLKKADLDFAFIDTEHISMNRAEMARACETLKAMGIAPIVRISYADPNLASMAVDAGAVGVVAPYIETDDQAKQLVGAVKYKPLKGYTLNQLINGKEKPSEKLKTYLDKLSEYLLCIANIESVKAMENLDSILSVEGLDAVFIGPHDLSVSLGLPEEYDNPLFEAAVKEIIQKTRKKGLSIGIHFSQSPERQIKWVNEGANIILHSFDIALFTQKLIQDMHVIRQGIGDDSSKSINNENIII